MIFHICPPDTLFVKYCLERFEMLKPGFNRCIVIVPSGQSKVEHNINKNLVDYFGPLNTSIITMINKSGCSAIIIHSLNDDLLELALNLKDNIPIIWRSWGPDLHNVIYPIFNPFLPQTEKLVGKRGILTESALKRFRSLRDYLLNKALTPEKRLTRKIAFLKKVSFIATVTETEYNYLLYYIPALNAKYLNLNYRSFDLDINYKNTLYSDSNRVMIGHSSFPYHNHPDIFYQIIEFNNYGTTLLVPLSYGNIVYRDKVIALGKSIFSSNMHFLTNFLPIGDYLKLISQNKAFILNSKIQSGGANVIYSLLLGSKVYLRKENPIYSDFIKAGIKLFSIQDDLNRDHLSRYLLSDSDKTKNMKILRYLFNPEREVENVRNVYKMLNV